jgi:transcriptional regulator with XRE-family HTH domain
MVDRSEIGPLVRELHNRLGCTEEKLAAKLGVSVQTIARWKGDCACAQPSSIAQQRIAQLLRELGVHGEDLLARYFGSLGVSGVARRGGGTDTIASRASGEKRRQGWQGRIDLNKRLLAQTEGVLRGA